MKLSPFIKINCSKNLKTPFGVDEVRIWLRVLAPNVKLIAASGFPEQTVEARLVRAGVKHYVQRQYAPAEILRTVREALEGEGE